MKPELEPVLPGLKPQPNTRTFELSGSELEKEIAAAERAGWECVAMSKLPGAWCWRVELQRKGQKL